MNDNLLGLQRFATMLAVTDIPRSIDFYCGGLGFVVEIEQPDYALITLAGISLYLVTESPPTADKPTVTLGITSSLARTPINLVFHVLDCHRVYETLVRQGVSFLTPPQQPEWGGWRCFTQDPDGYLLEFVTEE